MKGLISSLPFMNIKGRIILYSTLDCPSCIKAKLKFEQLRLPYQEICLDSYPMMREELKRRTGRNTVPQIFFNEIHIGGYDDLETMLQDAEQYARLLNLLKTEFPPSEAPRLPDPRTSVDNAMHSEMQEEPDEMMPVVNDFKLSGIIKSRGANWSKSTKRWFFGRDFIDWLKMHTGLDEESSLNVAQKLIDRHFMHDLNHAMDEQFHANRYYRLLEDEYADALNCGPFDPNLPLSVGHFNEIFRFSLINLYTSRLKYIKDKDVGIDYKALAKDVDFKEFVKLTKKMQRLKFTESTTDEKLAFFINVYNALVIHGNVTHGPPTTTWQRYKFFNYYRYVIGGYAYSLQDIENGLLRANRKGYFTIWKQFGKRDVRLKFSLPEVEPLIHFALNCGSKSCPPITVYSNKAIKTELKTAAESFLDSEDGLKIKDKQIQISTIFKWYFGDFGSNEKELLQFILNYTPNGSKTDDLKILFDSNSYNLAYLPYDWSH